MKIGTNLIFLGILSMLVGTAFASPLLLSELEIMPAPFLPEGPKAEFSVNVVYANFSIQDNPNITKLPFPFSEADLDPENFSAVPYFVVLNVTNHSDVDAVLLDADFHAAGEIYTDGVSGEKGTHGGRWWAEGAWLDGEWVNVTRFPSTQLENGTMIEGYLQEGVYLQDEYSNADNSLFRTQMYIDGSWVDVTGRINVTRNDDQNYYIAIRSDFLASSHYTFIRKQDNYNATEIEPFSWKNIWSGDGDFDNTWAPHQSRLIAFTGTQILTKSADGLKVLKTGNLTIHAMIRNYIPFNDTALDTLSWAKELKPIQLEITEDGYLYNAILSDDQMFVMDSFGVEVFIEPRS
jgi:hypothetical protein